MKLVFRNHGEPGNPGAPLGNLIIRLCVKKHPIFDRRGNDLYCEIGVNEGVLTDGAEIQISTLAGSRMLLIPGGTHSGDLLRIPGAGMPHINGKHRGDMFVEVKLKHAMKNSPP